MTQVQTIVAMMLKHWCSTADFQHASITSPHSRISEFKQRSQTGFAGQTNYYQVGNRQYELLERDRQIQTRWGIVKIREHKLKMVRHT
jgi:uncharacterized beta-barrel protein YwiB (DUF1934 family)